MEKQTLNATFYLGGKGNDPTRTLTRFNKSFRYARQLMKVCEEISELGAVVAKYAPINDDITPAQKRDIITEIADTDMCREHIKQVFGLTEAEITAEVQRKMKRAEKLLGK